MSFQNLISGAECATVSNPLSQVLKHTEGDRSLQQDRIAGPSSSRLHHLPSTSSAQVSEHDTAMARMFFEANSQQNIHSPTFSMLPHAELTRLAEVDGRPNLNEAWMREQQLQKTPLNFNIQARWASEFVGDRVQLLDAVPVQHNITSTPEFQSTSYASPMSFYSNAMPMGMYGMNYTPGLYQPAKLISAPEQSKGKGKSREVDFEAAFAQVMASVASPAASAQVESSRIVEVTDEMSDLEQSLQGWQLDTEQDAADMDEQIRLARAKGDLPEWEAQLNEMMNSQREELEHDYGGAMQDAWERGIGNLNEDVFPPAVQIDENGYPILIDYVFDTNNKHMQPSLSARRHLEEAKILLENNGSLSEAALLLEAAIQKGELGEGGYEAWILLGEARNMDEREDLGLRALIEGVKRSEFADAKGAGMLSLAISYTNESYDRASYAMLLRWLTARFPDYPIPEQILRSVPTNSTWDVHAQIKDLFIGLARLQYSQGVVDADVQVALGVLFYNTGEYDRAKDCFESALSERPQDYLIWNRLGSSLSNGNKPEEALSVYREALRLRPTYTRAIYNVGVACLNIGAHKEAAEHFLSALAMQESVDGGQTSEQLWFTLRRALLSMDRPDLADKANVENHPSLEIFRQQGFDF